MGYHPETMVCSFPRYCGRHGGFLYRLKPWIGFDVWHIDPERPSAGQRTDDSCGWFDRRPGPYADAVSYVLNSRETMHEISRAVLSRVPGTGPYGHTYPRMPLGECLAVVLLVAEELELRRWWNGERGNGGAHASWYRRMFTKQRKVACLAHRLALSPLDNFSSCDDAQEMVRLIAAALHREFRPWYRHPRWHVHHWRVHFDFLRNIRRMFERCGTCNRRLGFGYCPTQSGGSLHHGECLGIGVASAQIPTAEAE